MAVVSLIARHSLATAVVAQIVCNRCLGDDTPCPRCYGFGLADIQSEIRYQKKLEGIESLRNQARARGRR